MMKKDLYKTLGVEKTATAEEIKKAYRALAFANHPDRNAGKKAEEKFKEVATAYETLGDPAKRALYDKTGTAVPVALPIIPTKTGRYAVQRFAFQGDVADIYEAVDTKGVKVAVKIARDHRDNDLLENEAKALRAVYPADTTKKYYMYLPKLIDSIKVDAGSRRQANILEWLPDYYSLKQVQFVHPKLQMEHGVWMFNRMLEILGYIHNKKNYIHGAVLPAHVLVYAGTKQIDPLNHGARLVGWSCSVPVGQPLRAISENYEHFYPPEVFKKKPLSPASDIYMAAKCMTYVLGGEVKASGVDEYPAHLPNYLTSFIRGCVLKTQSARPQDAWALHKEFKAHMRDHYGPKKYVPFEMPLRA